MNVLIPSRKSIAFAMVAAMFLPWSGFAHAEAHCFCQIACQDNTGHRGGSVNGQIHDLGVLGSAFTGPFQQSDANQTKCNTRCTDAAAAIAKAQVQQWACQGGCPEGSTVRAWSKVGTKEWKSAQGYGVVHRTPEISTCKCPSGWLANQTNVDGGITADGKCKKDACGNSSVSPPPPNGTAIGNWGFTWGSGFVAWGTPANGGAAACKVTAGATCTLQ